MRARGDMGARWRERTARALVCAVLAALTLAHASPSDAQDLSHIPAAFVDVGVGPREMGMGGAAVAVAHGPSAVFWNPACLATQTSSGTAMVTYGDQMGLVPYSAAAGAWRLGDRWVAGVGLIYSGDDALSETTVLLSGAADLGTPSWTDSGRLLAGATIRVRRASYGDNESEGQQVTGDASGAALDAGAVVPLGTSSRAAVSLRDVAGVLEWNSSSSGSYEEGVPPAVVFGVAQEVGGMAVIEVDLDKSLWSDGRDVVSAGCEVRLFGMAALRAGYRRGLAPDELEEASIGGGATVTSDRYVATLDLAYVFGRLENTLRMGLTFEFGPASTDE